MDKWISVDEKQKAVYYKIGSYELGVLATGKRSSNYFCWCEIYDENEQLIKNHPLSDFYTGKWNKCEPIIKKWRKYCEKYKIINFPITHTQEEINAWDSVD